MVLRCPCGHKLQASPRAPMVSNTIYLFLACVAVFSCSLLAWSGSSTLLSLVWMFYALLDSF